MLKIRHEVKIHGATKWIRQMSPGNCLYQLISNGDHKWMVEFYPYGVVGHNDGNSNNIAYSSFNMLYLGSKPCTARISAGFSAGCGSSNNPAIGYKSEEYCNFIRGTSGMFDKFLPVDEVLKRVDVNDDSWRLSIVLTFQQL